MSFLKKYSSYSTLYSSPTGQPGPRTTWPSARKIGRPTILVAIAGTILLCVPLGSHVLAKEGQQAEATAVKDASAIDPDAVDAVKKMSAYLRTLKSLQITDNVTQDDVLENGLRS